MTVLTTDGFTGANGTTPTGWTVSGGGTGTIQTNKFRLSGPASDTYGTARAIRSGTAGATKIDTLVTFTTATTDEQYAFFYLRHNGSWGSNPYDPNTAYVLRLIPGATFQDADIQRYSGGVITSLGQRANNTETFTGTRRVIFEAINSGGVTTVRFKHWLATDPEPAAWNLSVTDNTPLALTGSAAIAAVNGPNTTQRPIDFGTTTIYDESVFAPVSSSSLAIGGGRTTSAVPVPPGVTSGDVVVVHHYTEDSAPAVTPPAGFAELTFPTTPATTGSIHRQRVFWKRLSAADSGTYNFTHAAAITEATAAAYRGALASGTPVEILDAKISNTPVSAPPAVSGTTGGPDRLLLYCATHYSTAADAQPPAGLTKVYDGLDIVTGYKAQAAAGATGSLVGTASADSNYAVTLVALIPAPPTLNKLKLGAGLVALRVGGAAASKAYIGTTQVWP